MGRKQKGERVLGPYRYRGRWRVVEVSANGCTEESYFATQRQAKLYIKAAEQNLTTEALTVHDAIDQYSTYLEKKGNKPRSNYQTERALLRFFPDPVGIWAVRERHCQEQYDELCEKYAVATHRNTLAQAKTFLNWCVKKRWLRANPAANVEGIGRRNTRKAQLTFKELRRWHSAAMILANEGDKGALAALLAYVFGLTCSEIVHLTVRSIDEEERPCDTIRVFDGKTKKRIRALRVPEQIRPLLLRLTIGREDHELLFGNHWRDWVRHQVHRICDLVELDRVSAHGMRGAHATVAIDGGLSAELVAGTLGHEDSRTTKDSYALEGVEEAAIRRRLFKLLEGGRKK